MRAAGMWVDGPEGYIVCYAVASQNPRLGLDVIADTVNLIQVTRQAWRNVAESLETPFVEIEVVCSDDREHGHRIETRGTDIPDRQYDVWNRDHIVIDTAY